MRRRTLLAGGGTLLGGAAGLAGCLEVQPLEGDGDDGGSGDSGDADGSADDGTEDGEFYASGTMEVLVDGVPVDLTADRFQAEYADEDVRFHFHEGDENWHMEEERVTFAAAVDLLPRFAYERQGDSHLVTVDGEAYDGRQAGTEVEFHVHGESVDPLGYHVQDGDHLALEVTTER